MKRIALVLALIIAFASLAGIVMSAPLSSLTVSVGSEPETIDPALNSAVDGAIYIGHLFEGIYTYDANGALKLGVAKSATPSADGKVWTIVLKDNLFWSDGKPLVAEDFVYAWKRAAAEATASPYAYLITDNVELDKTVAKDAKTIVLTLKFNVPFIKSLLAFPTFMPVRKDVVENKDGSANESWTLSPKTMVTNGMYKLSKRVQDDVIEMVANGYYHDKGSVKVPKLIFKLFSDDNAVFAAFKNNQLSLIDSYPLDEYKSVIKMPEYHVAPSIGTYYVSFNVKKAPLNNALVRKALWYAIDTKYIAEEVRGGGAIPANSMVAFGITDADGKDFSQKPESKFIDPSQYAKNAELAKKYLAEAGYPDGKGFPKLEYVYNTSSGHKKIAEALQQMWKKVLNIDVTLANVEWNVFTEMRRKGDYMIARNGWLADYDDPTSFLDLFVTGNGNNDGQYSNPKYDELMAKAAASTSNPKVRYETLHQAEKLIMDEAVAAPIFFYTDEYLQKTNLQGVIVSPFGFKYFYACSTK
ncbi:MAG TPA: peptide ABC transporter substrate-binding protein [Bacillota bacterium]|nr:peptide ABC transporter substrate-binding protein [Bacillota bacterium]HOA14934.1 peptide ABC transporter substrate-binding protein [Bacillota bacterium]